MEFTLSVKDRIQHVLIQNFLVFTLIYTFPFHMGIKWKNGVLVN